MLITCYFNHEHVAHYVLYSTQAIAFVQFVLLCIATTESCSCIINKSFAYPCNRECLFSICVYICLVFVSDRKLNATGFHSPLSCFCRNTAPIPYDLMTKHLLILYLGLTSCIGIKLEWSLTWYHHELIFVSLKGGKHGKKYFYKFITILIEW